MKYHKTVGTGDYQTI